MIILTMLLLALLGGSEDPTDQPWEVISGGSDDPTNQPPLGLPSPPPNRVGGFFWLGGS